MNIDISEINKNILKFMKICCKIIKMALIIIYVYIYIMVFQNQNEEQCGFIATFDEVIPF